MDSVNAAFIRNGFSDRFLALAVPCILSNDKRMFLRK
jgi:hypothetical protein